MSGERNDPDEHGLKELIDQLATPSYDEITRASPDSRDQDAARAIFEQAISATVACQRQQLNPTEAALHKHGGPRPDTMRRLLSGDDLSPLPFLQLDRTVDAGMIAAPCRLIVEARTEAATGPDRYGVDHLQPPSLLAEVWQQQSGGRRGAPNTRGGLSTAIVLAICETLVLPAVAVPIAQGYFDPENWPAKARETVRRRLRERERLDRPIVTGPADVVNAMLDILAVRTMLSGAPIDLDGLPVVGGRLRLGFPLGDPTAGGGRRDRFLGCSLSAIRSLRAQHLVPFLEIPAPTAVVPAGLRVTEQCNWEMQLEHTRVGLRELLEQAFKRGHDTWRLVPRALTGSVRILTLAATASQDAVREKVTLVLAIGARGERELFVTTLDHTNPAQLKRIVRLTSSELERRRPDSPVEQAIASLLRDCYLQTNRRRRQLERRSFAGLAQAAYTLAKLSDAA